MADQASHVREFLSEHRDLVLKHARAHVRRTAELVPAEDVAREMELELAQLAQSRSLDVLKVRSPDALLRAMVKHAAGRAKRRRKLVEQIAAGDDLQAVSDDLAALDADLADVSDHDGEDARAARAILDKVKAKLSARDALVFALIFEDDRPVADVATTLSLTREAVENARTRILDAARRELPPEEAT